jgi:hypothetical protein
VIASPPTALQLLQVIFSDARLRLLKGMGTKRQPPHRSVE